MPPSPKKESTVEDKVGIVPSHGISIDIPSTGQGDGTRPAAIRHMSTPAYESPIRHHQRKQSSAKEVKETLHARSEYTNSQDEGGAIHRINQYVIKQEIGRGSFGAVHLAVDQHGIEYAVKEFSKSRLRKRAQSNILRRPHGGARKTGHLAAGVGFNSPMHRNSSSEITDQGADGNPLYLIKEEIAVMKKLNHSNLVSLIEVLDDPNEDSLYMVLEMCKKGVIMKVGMEEQADPYDDESCRCWFRDLILGIEYLHAQGVVHRDIKPDNLLLTEDDVLKIVDFGVSEIFEKHSDMMTAKSAGSPAFLPPELCVARHGGISGKAADIWSMGVTLYCLRFGRIPFEQPGVLQLYESIKNDEPDLTSGPAIDDNFKDLMLRILNKNPATRIRMDMLRVRKEFDEAQKTLLTMVKEHPWVTKDGKDPLLSAEENTANLVEPPTEEEKNQAITGNLSNILVLMKAVKRFKNIISHKRPSGLQGILGKDTRMVQPPLSMSKPEKPPLFHKTRSVDSHDRRAVEQALVAEGVHRDIDLDSSAKSLPDRQDAAIAYSPKTPKERLSERDSGQVPSSPTSNRRTLDAHPQDHRPLTHAATAPMPGPHGGRGHAHDPLSDHLYLGLGPGDTSRTPSPPCVSESPPAADTNIYETAYDMEIQRLRAANCRAATLFLTRRVEKNEEYQKDERFMIARGSGNSGDGSKAKSGFARVLEEARMKAAKGEKPQDDQAAGDGDDVKMDDAL